ncbi:unnamed protein product [Sympodiomycopsis kandeliae]
MIRRQANSSPTPGPLPPNSFTTKDIEQDIRIIVSKAQQAEKALARGAEGPISLGRWPVELYELATNVVPRIYKLAYRDGQIEFYGDPDGVHNEVENAISKSIFETLQPMISTKIIESGPTTVKLDEGRGRKEADQSWRLAKGGEIETVLEVVWGNERTEAFEQEAIRWHHAGYNFLGIRVWWDGAMGNTAALETDSTFTEEESQEKVSLFFIQWEAGAIAPHAWRFGHMAAQESWNHQIVENQPEEVLFLPSKWFTLDIAAVRKVPIFISEIRAKVSECLRIVAGELPPDTREEWSASCLQELQSQRQMLDGPFIRNVGERTLTRLRGVWDRKIEAAIMASTQQEEEESD